jgi:hypothetical protein
MRATKSATGGWTINLNGRYAQPNVTPLNRDVFSFGLILHELLTGKPVFSPELRHSRVMKMIVPKVKY